MLIGRDNEVRILQDAVTKENSQFIAVYGRRRVGKTYLIREAYNYKFAFQYTGAHKLTSRKQLIRFGMELKRQGLKDVRTLSNWIEAFYELKRFLEQLPQGKKVVFLDELPWMDSPRSGFLSELEVFGMGGRQPEKTSYLLYAAVPQDGWLRKSSKTKAAYMTGYHIGFSSNHSH